MARQDHSVALSGCFGNVGRAHCEIDRTPRHDGGNRMLVDHLGHRITQQNHVLIKGFNLSLQFDTVNQIYRYRNMFPAQGVEKRVLEKLTFVVHDMFRVESC